MKVFLAHPGTQHSYHLASQLEKLGMLYKYSTGFTIPQKGFLHKIYTLTPASIKQKISGRVLYGVPASKVKQHRLIDLISFQGTKISKAHEHIHYRRNKLFQLAISTETIKNADVVIGFDTSSWILAERCKKLGTKFILDVSIAHPYSKEKIYRELEILYPQWAEHLNPKNKFFIDLERQEMELADEIVVPSRFVRSTYIENGVEESKMRINPFGTNVSFFKTTQKNVKGEDVRYLFFGGLNARKGLPFLLETWEEFNNTFPNTYLTIAGVGSLPDNYKLPSKVRMIGKVLPNLRQELYNQADVFVFPSFFEGLALVQIEAAACGLPIIGTTNSGAEELVTNGEEGFIISPGNKEELFAAMKFFILNKNAIEVMGKKALLRV
ncbi:MAG: glycosyltransferase family 4 protein, partial [Segetibacter sp.]